MATQYWLDGFRSLIGVIERDGGDKMVKNMGFYNAVHEGPTDEAKLTVYGCSSATSEVPSCVFVMGEGRIGVLKIGDCYCGTFKQWSGHDFKEEGLTQPMVDP